MSLLMVKSGISACMSIFDILYGMLGAAEQRHKVQIELSQPTYADPAMIRTDKDISTAVNNQEYAEVAYSTKSAKVVKNSTLLKSSLRR